MPLTDAYVERQKELRKPQIRGKVSIKTIPKKVRKKYNIHIGQITPFSSLLITK